MLQAVKAKLPPLSSARVELADHLAEVAAAQAEVERLRRPVDILRARIEAAETAQREAKAECARLTQQHAAALTAWATTGGKGNAPASSDQLRADAIGKAENAIQMLDASCKALAEAEGPLQEAQAKVAKLHAQTPGTVLEVIADLADNALDKLAEVRGDAAHADAHARAVVRTLRERAQDLQRRGTAPETVQQLFRLAEQLAMQLDRLKPAAPTDREIEDEIARWSKLMDRLTTNPETGIND